MIDWDEENRIAAIHDPGNTASYVYDDQGERKLKRGRYGETVYVNQFFTVRNGALATEHLYAGTTRIVSKLMPGQPIGTKSGTNGNGNTTNTTGTAAVVYNGSTITANGTTAGTTTTTGTASASGTGTTAPSGTGDAFPGQGVANRSDRANAVAQNDVQGCTNAAGAGCAEAASVKNPNLNGGTPGNSQNGGNGGNTGNGGGNGSGNNGGGNGGSGNGGGQGAAQGCANAAGAGCAGAASEFLFFYHPDHLGSTSYVTDENAKLYEHMEYFPFGETWVSEANNNWKTPYLFTSKELDSDTQLYYYGARYYDPRTSVWQSADPADRATPKSPTIGLNMYQYGLLNPLKMVDPDGAAEIAYVYIFDIKSRPNDRGVSGETYTGTAYVSSAEHGVHGPYSVSLHPNSVSASDNSSKYVYPKFKGLSEGGTPYINKYGHKATSPHLE